MSAERKVKWHTRFIATLLQGQQIEIAGFVWDDESPEEIKKHLDEMDEQTMRLKMRYEIPAQQESLDQMIHQLEESKKQHAKLLVDQEEYVGKGKRLPTTIENGLTTANSNIRNLGKQVELMQSDIDRKKAASERVT